MANHTAQSSLPPVPAVDSEPIPASERRHGERLPARLQVLVKGASDADPVQMRTVDVSSGGLFVAASAPLGLGTLVKLRRAETLGVDGVGRVVWVRGPGESSAAEPPGMGIKFIRLSDQSKEDIEQLAKSPPEEALAASDEMGVQPQEVQAAPPPDPLQAVVAQMTQAAHAAQNRPTDASPPDDGGPSPTRGHTMVCAYVESPAPEQHPVAPSAVEAHRVTPTVRHGAFGIAGMCALGALGWAAWSTFSPQPLIRATHAAIAEPPAEATINATPKSVPEAPSPALVPVVTTKTPGHSETPERLEPATLPHVLHVETDPPGAWLVVAGQRVRTPADIELPNYDGKRLGLTISARQREEQLVYVLPSNFIARGDAMRANVRLKLKHKGPGAESPSGQGAPQEAVAQPAAPTPEEAVKAAPAPPPAEEAPAAVVNSAVSAAEDPTPGTQ